MYAHTHTCVSAQLLSVVQPCATPWTGAWQAPLSVGLLRQEYWSGLPFPSPGVKSMSPALAGISFTPEPPEKPMCVQSIRLTEKLTKKKKKSKDIKGN